MSRFLLLTVVLSCALMAGCWQVAMAPMAIDTSLPWNYMTVRVRVIRAATGFPVSDVAVRGYHEWGVNSGSAVTDADGRASLRIWKPNPELFVSQEEPKRVLYDVVRRTSGSEQGHELVTLEVTPTD